MGNLSCWALIRSFFIRKNAIYLPLPQKVDLIRNYKYDADEYSVKTEDGYILALTRIRSHRTKPPVLMVHGVLAASDTWVLRGPEKDLAFILADQGHDVWLADSRGNYFSRNHETLTVSDPKFWDFSFHEMGVYDLPALIDTVLTETNHSQLYYVGHSMGTTQYFVLCSLKPEYNQKVKTALLLAPVAFGLKKEMTSLLKLLLQNVNLIAEQLKKQHVYDFMPRTRENQQLVDFACADSNRQMCKLLVNQLYGTSQANIKNSDLRLYLKRLVSGTSVKSMEHLAQIFKTKQFMMFDYGKTQNQQLYSQDTPPPYPVEKVTSPVAMFYGDNDVFVDDHSIEQLEERLPNVIVSVALPEYNHIDPIFADSSTKLLYRKIAKLFRKS